MRILFTLYILSLLLLSCHQEKRSTAIELLQKGELLGKQELPDSAVNVYLKVVDLLRNSKEHELLGIAYNQLGDLFLRNDVFDKAFNAHSEALKSGLLLKDKTQASRAYRGIGKNFLVKKDFSKAFVYFTKAFNLKDSIKSLEEQGAIYNNMSFAYLILKEYEKALLYNSKAIFLTKDSTELYRNYSGRGRLFTLTRQYDSALYYLNMAEQSKNIRIKASSLQKMAEMPSESGMTDSMKFVFLNKAQQLRDSIEDIGKGEQLAEKEHLYQLNNLKDKNSNMVLVIISGTILILIVSTYFYYQNKKNKSSKITENQDKESNSFENNERERQFIAIAGKTGSACVAGFTTSSYYMELKKKLEKENYVLTYAEQEELKKVIFKEFDGYIRQISSIVNLSVNDSLLCCLSLLKFTTKECASCRGVSSETIRSQKARIKKKIPKTFLMNGFFETIFGEE